MAFLVLALSIMPCADAAAFAGDGKIKSELTKTPQKKDHPQQDDCSPFCQCNCCAGFSIHHITSVIALIPPYSNSANTVHLPAAVRSISLPIWQPPQLV
jgi:hypothetical protein